MAAHKHRVVSDARHRKLQEALADQPGAGPPARRRAVPADEALPFASDDDDDDDGSASENGSSSGESDSDSAPAPSNGTRSAAASAQQDSDSDDDESGSDAVDDEAPVALAGFNATGAAISSIQSAPQSQRRSTDHNKRRSPASAAPATATEAAQRPPRKRRRTLDGSLAVRSADGEAREVEATDVGVRDSGFARPRVLVLAPFRHSALQFVETWLKALPSKITTQLHRYKRFKAEFSLEDDEDGSSSRKSRKSLEFQHTFCGNVNDDFKLGVSLTSKSVQFYTRFSRSDLIVASPVALRQLVGATAEDERETEFLAAIEVVVVLDAHVLEMQNWEHVEHVMTALNCMPQREMPEGADLNRVRAWALDGEMKQFRQTIMLTDWVSAQQRHFQREFCSNFEGSMRLRATYPTQGSLSRVAHAKARFTFQRFPVTEFASLFQRRNKYFLQTVLPRLRRFTRSQLLIFVPTYFSFVVVRNFMTKSKLDFVNCCEYTKRSIVTRGRAMFKAGQVEMLLVTERFMFFKRHRIRGAKHVVFLGPPQNPELFPQVINELDNVDEDSLILTLYCQYDAFELERVVGLDQTRRLLQEDGDVHVLLGSANAAAASADAP